MLDYRLSDLELSQPRAAHRRAPSAREAYRINAVILVGQGWSAAEVADALLIDADTVPNDFKRYKQGGLDALLRMNFVGSEALLDPAQIAEVKTHLREHLHPNAASVARRVEELENPLHRQRHDRTAAPHRFRRQKGQARPG